MIAQRLTSYVCDVPVLRFCIAATATITTAVGVANPALSTTPSPSWRIVVNSNADGKLQPDAQLTLREAIALANGTLSIEQLSAAEKAQVMPSSSGSIIAFDLPQQQTTIFLSESLPALTQPGLVIDGTTQPGYVTNTNANEPSTPMVAIAPAPQTTILRGLTITADNVTIRGLSLYGFSGQQHDTASLPPADIFITYPRSPALVSPSEATENGAAPQNTVIENNWLGIAPTGQEATTPSAFGVSVFNGEGTVIQHNRIANHSGSGIITAVQADNLVIRDNIIENNGFTGIPDAIRLEGAVNNTQIESNRISGNAGSGVFLFKPDGSVTIQHNQLTFNGQRLRRAAIYLLGDSHQVVSNVIQDQPGPGVVVGAFPRSIRNVIQNNRFARLDGLSIDLNTQLNAGVEDFQRGDGPNPPRNSANRRLETGNAAINAPRFLSSEFLIINGRVGIDGVADVGSQVDLYRVEEEGSAYGPLSEAIATTTTDADGRFSFTLESLQPGDRVSAIATDSRYGTSEPALNAVIQSLIRN
jgi:parallel beta-helix repeat protein